MSTRSKRLNVLLLSGQEAATELLREILARHVELANAGSLEELHRHLERGRFDAFLCEWSFQGGTWQDALSEIQDRYPGLPTIVVSRVGEEREWVEVLAAGAFDLVTAPFCERAVLSVLEHAVASYRGRSLERVA